LDQARFYKKVDVVDEESTEAGIQYTLSKFGAIHICINCAGMGAAIRTINKSGPYPLDTFKFVVDLNLVGTFNVLRLAAFEMQKNQPLTKDSERGVIINTASVAGYDGQTGQAAYSASKAGVMGMTLPIARDLAPFGIRINTICPGYFATELMKYAPSEMINGLVAHTQFPHRAGEPLEFAKLAIHIIENSYINGEVIRLDAALRMPAK